MSWSAIILCAGSSTRFGRDKLWLPLDGKPLWFSSYQVLLSHPLVTEMVIVSSPGREAEFAALVPDAIVVASRGTRGDSVVAGCRAAKNEWVLVHDGARPFVLPELIDRVVHDAPSVPVIPVTDTIWQKQGSAFPLDRGTLFAAQTPQSGRREEFIAGYEKRSDATDDGGALCAIGIQPRLVEGDPKNRKITRPNDWQDTTHMETRTGLGYDIHSFSTDPNRPMWLGGLEFASEKPGLDGHSDADALLHAITDALLGAAGLADIGDHYPNTDSRWKNAPSIKFLREAVEMLEELGWKIVNIDSSVVAERPKIAPVREQMREIVAEALKIETSRVSIKATTNEKLGAIGRGEGVAAFAVATISRNLAG